MKFAIALLLMVSVLAVQAQDAFIVTTAGDTFEFDKVKIGNKEIAGMDANKSRTVFAPQEVKAIHDAGRTYIPLLMDNRQSGSPAFFKDSTLHFGQLMATKGAYKLVLLNIGVLPGEPVVSYDIARFYVVDESGTSIKWICTPFGRGCPLDKFNAFRQYFDVDCPEYVEAYKKFAAKPRNISLFNKLLQEQRNCTE